MTTPAEFPPVEAAFDAHAARQRIAELELELARAKKTMRVLMDRAEQSMNGIRGRDMFARNLHLQRIVERHTHALIEAYQRLQEENRQRLASEAARKDLEAQVVQQERMVAIGSLASGIAHEINTPIQFIGDSAQFLEDAAGDVYALVAEYAETIASEPGLPPETKERFAARAREVDLQELLRETPRAFARMREGLQRVGRIVGALRTFAHPGYDLMHHEDLHAAIANTLIVAHSVTSHIADVEVAFGDIPPVECDVGALRQVFLNLVVNAAQAIEDRARTDSMAHGRIHIATHRDGDMVRIDISDNGCGVPESLRARIYDPFFTTKDVGRGTGQGLAIARNIVCVRHRGRLELADVPGWATTFRIELPVTQA